MIIVLVVLLSALTILISFWYMRHLKYAPYLKQYVGPPSVPLFGTALHFRNKKGFLLTLAELHRKYGPVLKLQANFFPPVLQIIDPKLLESLLGNSKILSKGNSYKYFQAWLGTGLVTSEPIKWKHHRRIITPSFHFQILEQFLDAFNAYSDILVSRLKDVQEKDSIEIFTFLSLCTLDIICATSMGSVINAQNDGSSEYVKNVKQAARAVSRRIQSILGASDFLYSLTPSYQEQQRTIKNLHDYSNGVIASRKKELEENQTPSEKSDRDMGIKVRNSFLDTLLKYRQQGGSLTDLEIREEVDTFMFAGHDTTATALSFLLYNLANHPEIQKKVVEEMREIFGDENRTATYRDLQEMKYMEMVIKESLRLFPPISHFGRRVEEDTEFNGAILPKGVSLNVCVFALHRDPKIYPDPERFDPERFTPENQAKRSPYAFIPFSAGPRNCIGQKFAMLVLKSVASNVLRNFVLLPAIPKHELNLHLFLVLNSTTGVKIRLQERKW